MRRRRVCLLLVAGVVVALLGACSGGEDGEETSGSVLSTWYDQTDEAVSAQGAPDPVAARTWALAWWAADRAVGDRPDGAFADAATASAVHDVLVALVPEREDALDDALDDTPGDADDAGTAAGEEAAAEVLALRADDGLDPEAAERPLPVPEPATGVWRPTPTEFKDPRQAAVEEATPFLLTSADQLRPGPPPRPGTPLYRRDLAEVRTLGRDDSATRTPAQTAVALFWEGSELAVQVRLVREALQAARVSTVEGVRLLSAFHRITTDAEIAVFDAKYTYFSWRPVTAIEVDGDGDPRTPRLSDWAPLIETPGHPEYPSAHTVYAGAAAAVLAHFLGPAPARPLVVEGTDPEADPRTYTTWRQAVDENEDARVWAGIHVRHSDEVGSRLGRQVARYGLAHL